MSKYGICPICFSYLGPVWFTEDEKILTSAGYYRYTGRKRKACSHLECYSCGHKEIIDDTFDGDWY